MWEVVKNSEYYIPDVDGVAKINSVLKKNEYCTSYFFKTDIDTLCTKM